MEADKFMMDINKFLHLDLAIRISTILFVCITLAVFTQGEQFIGDSSGQTTEQVQAHKYVPYTPQEETQPKTEPAPVRVESNSYIQARSTMYDGMISSKFRKDSVTGKIVSPGEAAARNQYARSSTTSFTYCYMLTTRYYTSAPQELCDIPFTIWDRYEVNDYFPGVVKAEAEQKK